MNRRQKIKYYYNWVLKNWKTINTAGWEHHLWLHLMIVMQNNQLVAICKKRGRMVNANWRLAANEIKTGDLLERRLKPVWLLVVTVCNGAFYLLHILLTIGLTTLKRENYLIFLLLFIYLFIYLFCFSGRRSGKNLCSSLRTVRRVGEITWSYRQRSSTRNVKLFFSYSSVCI